MKRIRFFVLTGMTIWSLNSGAASCPSDIKLGWEPYAPFQMKTAKGDYTGIDFDLTKEILGKMNCKFTFVQIPWPRLLAGIQNGDVHITPSASKTTEREAFAYFSEPYVTVRNVLLMKKGESSKIKIANLADLAKVPKFKLGVSRSYEYGDIYTAAIKLPAFKAIIEEANDEEQSLKKLMAGRVQGILVNEFTYRPLAKKDGSIDQLEIHPVNVGQDTLFFMFSKKSINKEIVTAFNSTLATIKADGSYQKIIDKYLK